MGSFDFSIKLKIKPKNFVPSFGTIYRATLLISDYYTVMKKMVNTLVNKHYDNWTLRKKLSQKFSLEPSMQLERAFMAFYLKGYQNYQNYKIYIFNFN